MGPSFPWNLNSASARKEISRPLWNQRFHYRVHWYLSWARWIQSLHSYSFFKIFFNIRLPLYAQVSRATKSLYLFLISFMPRPPHCSWCDNPNKIWCRLQIMKLFIMQFPPASCYFLPLRPNIVLSTLFSSAFFMCMWENIFTPIQSKR
jgi:hypothetical protein